MKTTGHVLVVTPENIEQCEAALNALLLQFGKFVKLVEEYPLECSYAGCRFVFETGADVYQAVGFLSKKINDFKTSYSQKAFR